MCRYDRAEVGRSSQPVRQDRTGEDVVAELRALLNPTNLVPPYVLVGHPFGGYPVQLFTHTYPNEVTGIV